MSNGEEYEVESITRARVHDKKGKKITWRYYVKWKGYGWDDSTWEPTDSFQGGSEHILEAFWQRIDTGGREIADAKAFKKGEELFISGPPGKGLKRKASTAQLKAPPPPEDAGSSKAPAISAPPLSPRKRRRMQIADDDEDEVEEPKLKRQAKAVVPPPRPKRRVSVGGQKNEKKPAVKTPKRRRASSPGPRKTAPKRLPSATDSHVDADGETDPDAVEVEDELMQISVEDADERPAPQQLLEAEIAQGAGADLIAFDDLEHFYSGNPIDIEQGANEPEPMQESEPEPDSEPAPAPQRRTPKPKAPASPAPSSPDPLFDSPSQFSENVRGTLGDPSLPFHRARATNPLVKIIDPPAEAKAAESRITAKARLMSVASSSASSAAGPSRNTARRGAKPGPGRSSSGLLSKNRSSLLTASKGRLQSVKGKFTPSTTVRDQPDDIEEAPPAEERRPTITSWSDEDVTGATSPELVYPVSDSAPSGDELLKLAGLGKDAETLPDFEDASAIQEKTVNQPVDVAVVAEDEEKKPVAEATEAPQPVEQPADTVAATESAREVSPLAVEPIGSSIDPVAAAAAAEAKRSLELAKEHLFPSAQSSFTFTNASSSFKSTIFGPLYTGPTPNHASTDGIQSSTNFKVTLDGTIEIPLVLKDCHQMKERISDVTVGKSSSGKVAVFYSSDDALAIAGTLKSNGTARVVLDSSADDTQKENFSTFFQRFESLHTLCAPFGSEMCVLYSSENAGIAQKLSAPSNLVGLSNTLLVSRASIENQLAYVAAALAAKPL